jgi:hypothetical protein
MDINLFRNHLAKNQKSELSESVEIIDDTQRPKGYTTLGDAYIAFRSSNFRDRSLFLPDKNDKANFSASELKNVFRWYHQDNPKMQFRDGGLIKIDLKKGTIQFTNDDRFVKAGGTSLPNSVWGPPIRIVRFRYNSKEALEHAR